MFMMTIKINLNSKTKKLIITKNIILNNLIKMNINQIMIIKIIICNFKKIREHINLLIKMNLNKIKKNNLT